MAGLTAMQAQTQLDSWLKANLAVSHGQSYTIATESGSRTLTRANAAEILQQIQFWDRQVKQCTKGGIRMKRGVYGAS